MVATIHFSELSLYITMYFCDHFYQENDFSGTFTSNSLGNFVRNKGIKGKSIINI